MQRPSCAFMRHRPAIVRVALAFALCACRPAFAQDAPATDALTQARDALDHGALDRADALLTPLSRASDGALAAQARFFLGDASEKRFRFADALAHYRGSIARDPGGRYASRAQARVDYLQARAEGDFAPLAALERVRSDPARASDPRAIADLARATEGFPAGTVRVEARLLVGQAYMGRLDRPHDAIPVLRALAQDPAATRDVHRLALELLGQARDKVGEFAEGISEQRALGGTDDTIALLSRHRLRRRLHTASWIIAVLVLLAGIFSVARAARARRVRGLVRAWSRPLPLAHIAMFSVGGALLAHTYEEHDMSPFFAFGAGALAVYLAATAWSYVGSPHPLARTGRAISCALAMLAAALLAMHHYDIGLLEGLGL